MGVRRGREEHEATAVFMWIDQNRWGVALATGHETPNLQNISVM